MAILQSIPLTESESAPAAISQRAAARIAGALAHEVNSPLQGVQSLVGLLNRDCQGDPDSMLRLQQVRSGLARIGRIVETFAVAYENMPRAADTANPTRFSELLAAAVLARQLTCEFADHSAVNDCRFHCMLTETARLIAEVFAQAADGERCVRVEFADAPEHIAVLCRLTGGDPESVVWTEPDGTGSVSGIAVLLNEITRMADGTTEFCFDDRSLTGVRLLLKKVMTSC